MTELPAFAPDVREWFAGQFEGATDVQVRGWSHIAAGEHALLCAPTGSGKTLAAFLWCIDRLARLEPGAEPGVRVLYISPLKALAYDIERNLERPLAGIGELARARGSDWRRPSVAVRTGDTTQKARRRQLREPGDIFITTPESLYLVLGSQARETLRSVETVIIDEIHALAPNKRGAHLALSLERLCHLTGRDVQRVGLSATQRPLEEVARYLGGDRDVAIVDSSSAPSIDLEIMVPVADMEDPAAGIESRAGVNADDAEARRSIWPSVYPRLLELIRAHTSTIIFANSRRLAERLAQQLNELAEEDLVRAHHGSVARRQRLDIEQQLKDGQLRGLVATSSLELGIDMGAVDLVVQIESPGSVARGLQRIGRAGHDVGARSVGKLFPKFRGDLLESAVVARCMLDQEIEPLRVPRSTLDVLAQQIVAMCAVEPWPVAALHGLVRRTYNFADVSEHALASVLDMLSGRYPSDEFSELRPRINWNRADDTLSPRPGAKMLSLVNGGTIPDRGLYAVHLGEDGPRIGELDEEMVHESRTGETFLLGATTWRIQEITRDRVIVSPAPGEPGRMPFWRGEGPGRPIELGRALGAFIRRLDELDDDEAIEHLRAEHFMDPLAAENLVRYIDEQRQSTGTLPTDRSITIERFRDELGDWRVCILSPFGARVHAPWALAVERTLADRGIKGVQTLWSDDGVVLRLPDTDALPDTTLLLPDPDEVEELIVDQLGSSAMFATHFRENAARALLLPRRRPGTRTPLWVQRMRSQTLLGVAQQYPGFPIVLETYRECLQDVFDMPALVEVLGDIRAGRVRVDHVETPAASPFARSLVFAYVATYLYEGDAPIAERKAQALTLDRNLLRELLGSEELRDLLDAEVVDDVEAELQHLADTRRARHADALHDVLRRAGDLDAGEIAARCDGDATGWLADLAGQTRAVEIELAGTRRWIAAEDAGRYRDAFGCAVDASLPAVFLEPVAGALSSVILRWARHHGPFHPPDIAGRYGLDAHDVDVALRELAAAGRMLHGDFRPGGVDREWCTPEVLRTLRRRTLAKLRSEVAPVEANVLGRFLPAWHGADRPARGGAARLGAVLGQLEGVAVPLSDLESRILPARIRDYHPRMLDELGATGELIWIGRGGLAKTDMRVALYRRSNVSALAPPVAAGAEDDLDDMRTAILAHLRERGASFLVDVRDAAGNPPSDQLMAALWDLACAGLVTNDTFQPLRALRTRNRARRSRRSAAVTGGGRWAAVDRVVGERSETARAAARAQMLLDRYGIVSREAAVAESIPGGFSAMGKVLRAMEEAGKARRGYFVEGLSGAQFAHPLAVDRLRAERNDDGADGFVVLAADDPANPYGALLRWPPTHNEAARPSRRAGALVVLSNGHCALYVESGGKRLTTFRDTPDVDRDVAFTEGLPRIVRAVRRKSMRVEHIDGVPTTQSTLRTLLARAGFVADYRGDTLEV